MAVPTRRLIDSNGVDVVGAVTASPVSNTLLARLKDLLTGIVLATGSAIVGKVGIDQVTANANEVVVKSGTVTTVASVTAIAGALPAGTNLIGKVGIDQTTLGTTNGVVRVKGGLLNSGVKSADAVIKGTPGAVYWVSVSDTAALLAEIEDHATGGGTNVWAMDFPAGAYAHFIFDPPIECANGIYLDVSTATCKVTIGYK